MKIDLDEECLNLLEDMYRVKDDPTRVNYAHFVEDVEIVFTKQVFYNNLYDLIK